MKKVYETVGVMAVINPQLANNTTLTSAWVDIKNIDRLMFCLSVGATDTTVDAKLMQASTPGGGGATDISGYAITQLGAADDNKQVIIEIDAAAVIAANPGMRYVALRVTVGSGTTGAYISAVGLGYNYDYSYPADFDLASVKEIVG